MKGVLLVIAAVIALVKGCDVLLPDMCGNYSFSEHPSPDGSLKAVIFQRDCGATTGFSTQISMLSTNEALPNQPGNIFRISGHPDNVAPDIDWLADSSGINIHYKLDGSEFLAESSSGWFAPISVNYQTNDG